MKLSEKKRKGHLRNLCRTDLYFLLRYILNRPDVERPWLFDRCREVQAGPNGYLDLWAREHYKSTIITFAKTIQDILQSHGEEPLPEWNGREATIGIFSHTRPIAKKFLRQIQIEFETSLVLKDLFPDILYANPDKEAPMWALDSGIIVRRDSNPKEATVEAWGLVDGQPTSVHFMGRVYDDVVTRNSVGTPDMIAKTTEAWEISQNLGTEGGYVRTIGTRYHFNDTYKTMIDRGSVIPRLHAATDNGEADGEPVLITKESLIKKRRDQGVYTFGCQMLLNPKSDKAQGFDEEWLQFYDSIEDSHHTMNKYILVDPANEKKKKSDYTAMVVIGAGLDENYYLLDVVRDKLSLKERTDTLFELRKQWKTTGRDLDVYYEKYGKDSDIEHIRLEQEREGYRFPIKELGGQMAKNDRIRRMVPTFEDKNFIMPRKLIRVDYEGKTQDIIHDFINNEYLPFPVGEHDDMFDIISRIKDVPIKFPQANQQEKKPVHIPNTIRRFANA